MNLSNRLKILCICEHGNIRSVALAYLLKTIYGHEAIAIGYKEASEETFEMLYFWADKVVDITDGGVKEHRQFDKIFRLDVGKDIWHDARHPDLMHKLYKELKGLNL